MKPNDAEDKKKRPCTPGFAWKKAGKAPAAPIAKADTATVQQPAIDSAALKSPFGASLAGSEQLITLENKDIRLKLSTRGGRVFSAELKNYKTFDKKPLILFDGTDNKFGATITAGSTVVNTNDRYFTTTATNTQVAAQRFCIHNFAL